MDQFTVIVIEAVNFTAFSSIVLLYAPSRGNLLRRLKSIDGNVHLIHRVTTHRETTHRVLLLSDYSAK